MKGIQVRTSPFLKKTENMANYVAVPRVMAASWEGLLQAGCKVAEELFLPVKIP